MKKIIALLLAATAVFMTACQPIEALSDALKPTGNGETVDVVLLHTHSPEPMPAETPQITPENTVEATASPEATEPLTEPIIPSNTAVVYSAEDKLVALTFDDGPYKDVTPRILDVVEQYIDQNVHVTFFVLGLQVAKYPDIVARAASLGCEIGNHTYHHKNLTKLTVDEMHSEVNDVAEMITELTDKPPLLVRPPYGAKNDNVFSNVPYPLILWDIDTLDWSTHNTASTVEAVLKCEDGDIVLMHDVHEDTADAAEELIPKLLEKGFKLVTVSELFAAKGIALEQGKSYRRAR